MNSTQYEIRNAETGWKLLANANERDVRRFWEKNRFIEKRTQKIDGVIVIFVAYDMVPA